MNQVFLPSQRQQSIIFGVYSKETMRIRSNFLAYQIRDEQMIEDITVGKLKEKHKTEIQHLREQLATKAHLLEQAQRKLQEQEKQNVYNYKRQFRRLADSLGQKQSEILMLNKQSIRQKNRIASLQADISSITSAKQALEHTSQKAIQLLKAQMKQLTSVSDQAELGRFMYENNYRQASDRLESISNVHTQIQNKKKHMEEKYQKLKKDYAQVTQKNIELQIQVERQRQINYKQIQATNQKKPLYFQTEKQQKMSKHSILSKQSVQDKVQKNSKFNNPHYFNDPNQEKMPQNDQIFLSKLQETISLLSKDSKNQTDIHGQISRLYSKYDQENQLLTEIISVKQQNKTLKNQINDLKTNFIPTQAEEVLSKDHPRLYEFFVQKKQEVQHFDERLDTLERSCMEIMEMIKTIATEGVPQKKIEPNQSEIIQRQQSIRSKVRKELAQKFQSDKLKIKSEIQAYFQQQVQSLKKQIQRLNLDMYELMQEFDETFQHRKFKIKDQQKPICMNIQIEQTKSQQKIEQRPEFQQSSQTQSEQAHSKNKQKSKQERQKNSQLITYLQMKSQKLEKQNLIFKEKAQVYKKQLRLTLQNYRIKSTKLKIIRCNQCMLPIKDGKQRCELCKNCKMEFHQNECSKIHLQSCQKIRQGVKPKPKPKKTSNNLANKSLSQQIDYF